MIVVYLQTTLTSNIGQVFLKVGGRGMTLLVATPI